MHNSIELPSLEYLQFGNIYAGSQGKLNYKIIPDTKVETMLIAVWQGAYCMEKSEIAAESEFELTKSGWEQAQDWLAQQLSFAR